MVSARLRLMEGEDEIMRLGLLRRASWWDLGDSMGRVQEDGAAAAPARPRSKSSMHIMPMVILMASSMSVLTGLLSLCVREEDRLLTVGHIYYRQYNKQALRYPGYS